MNTLPRDIISYIHDFIPRKYLVILSKFYYNKYHCLQRESIPMNIFHSYIRDMIRNDCWFILGYLLKEYENQWRRSSNYRYKKKTYGSYYLYLLYYSLEQESLKCRNLLNDKYNTDQKQHKKVRSKKYKWIR